jgi:uroporphyrinogen-III synthase
MRLLVTRPESDASEQAEKLRALGHEPVLSPLLRIEFLSGSIEFGGAQALIVTSRNALRALAAHRALSQATELPLIAVGEATANLGSALGFTRIERGPGSAEELSRVIAETHDPKAGKLVHLSGETIAFDLAADLAADGFEVKRQVLYRSVQATDFPPKVLSLLNTERLDGVILMSPRTSATFSRLIRRHGLTAQTERLICYCLSEKVAEALQPVRPRLAVAARPNEEEVLALIESGGSSSQGVRIGSG